MLLDEDVGSGLDGDGGRWRGGWKCVTEQIHEDMYAETLVMALQPDKKSRMCIPARLQPFCASSQAEMPTCSTSEPVAEVIVLKRQLHYWSQLENMLCIWIEKQLD